MKKKRFHRPTPHKLQWFESYSLFFSTQLFSPSLSFCSLMVLFTEHISIQTSNLAYNWAQLKRADNCALKEENYRIRYENNAIREALKYATKILTLMNRRFESKMLREE
ncbi:unnamed protein product [Brassica oleracea]